MRGFVVNGNSRGNSYIVDKLGISHGSFNNCHVGSVSLDIHSLGRTCVACCSRVRRNIGPATIGSLPRYSRFLLISSTRFSHRKGVSICFSVCGLSGSFLHNGPCGCFHVSFCVSSIRIGFTRCTGVFRFSLLNRPNIAGYSIISDIRRYLASRSLHARVLGSPFCAVCIGDGGG